LISFGIIGTGRIAGAHARAVQMLEGTCLAGCVDVDPERLAGFIERFPCVGYASHEELLARPEIDAVSIALPHWLHCPVTVAALEAGKHVIIEKPMAMTVAECDAMIAAAERADRRLMIAHSQQFFPVNETVRALIAAGEIGRIVFATDTWYKPFYEVPRPPWFLDAAKGGGMWPMNGPHMIDRMTMFIQSRVVAVKAMVGTHFVEHPTTDTGVALLQFANGVHATIQHCGYIQGVDRFEGEITGTRGQLKFSIRHLWRSVDGQYVEVPVEARRPRTKPDWPPEQRVDPVMGNQFAAFVHAIRTGDEPPVSGHYGREIVRVLEACEESARTGCEVRLDEPTEKP
jgi:phthalate 4,5-cis-dihydrodiol dehydrogenase